MLDPTGGLKLYLQHLRNPILELDQVLLGLLTLDFLSGLAQGFCESAAGEAIVLHKALRTKDLCQLFNGCVLGGQELWISGSFGQPLALLVQPTKEVRYLLSGGAALHDSTNHFPGEENVGAHMAHTSPSFTAGIRTKELAQIVGRIHRHVEHKIRVNDLVQTRREHSARQCSAHHDGVGRNQAFSKRKRRGAGPGRVRQ